MRLIRGYAERVGIRPLVDGMMAAIMDAHAIRRGGAYPFIVEEGVTALHPQHWTGGTRPGLVSEDGKPFLLLTRPIRAPRARACRRPHQRVRR